MLMIKRFAGWIIIDRFNTNDGPEVQKQDTNDGCDTSTEVAFQNGLRLTVDFSRES
jgi:hypothetical protein